MATGSLHNIFFDVSNRFTFKFTMKSCQVISIILLHVLQYGLSIFQGIRQGAETELLVLKGVSIKLILGNKNICSSVCSVGDNMFDILMS